jgi:hypothetical protein
MVVKMDTLSLTKKENNTSILNVEVHVIFEKPLFTTIISICKYLQYYIYFITQQIFKSSANNKKISYEFWYIYVLMKVLNKKGPVVEPWSMPDNINNNNYNNFCTTTCTKRNFLFSLVI